MTRDDGCSGPDIPANRSEKENRHLVGESEHTQQRRRTRQFIDQPKLRSGLHPRADKRYELSRDEKLKVAVLHGAKRVDTDELFASI